MPSPDIPCKAIKGTNKDLYFKKTVEYEKEKWCNKVWLIRTFSGHYKAVTKTTVENKVTDKKEEEKTYIMLLKERKWFERKILGRNRYAQKEMPDIPTIVKLQVKKLAKKSENMKSEEQLIEKITEEIQNQAQDLDFEKTVEEVKNR